jgi:hypothetical protein
MAELLKVKFAHIGWWKSISAIMMYILLFSSHFTSIRRIKKNEGYFTDYLPYSLQVFIQKKQHIQSMNII